MQSLKKIHAWAQVQVPLLHQTVFVLHFEGKNQLNRSYECIKDSKNTDQILNYLIILIYCDYFFNFFIYQHKKVLASVCFKCVEVENN